MAAYGGQLKLIGRASGKHYSINYIILTSLINYYIEII